ncbi:MAG: acetylornithine transaminase [Chloroflexota bacterium]|nr:acetylornithine transaminase [Chloroflexota bacterium]
MNDWQEMESHYLFATYKRQPVTLVRGQGVRVWDDQGREYLDFVGGIASVSLGHCHPAVVAALAEQAGVLIQASNWVYTVPQVRLAQLLTENSCFDRVFFCNSGAEAVEGAIKLARKWGREKRDGAYEIICALNAFHGRTLTALTAGGTEKYKAPYHPLPPGFVHVPFNDVAAIRQATGAKTCAVLLEPIQGEGGVNVPGDGYLRQVRAWCDQAGILLILDEVQTGIGRTGSLFAYQQYGAEPDVMTLAKGLGSGVPIGAVLAKEHCAVFAPGDHGSTFGGNPLCTSVGYAVLKYIIDNDIPGQVARKGQHLERRLRSLADRHPLVTEVRGRGLLWAIELDGELAETAVRLCLEEGLIANNVKPTALRLMPPLVVSEEELDRAVEIIDGVLTKMESAPQR